MLMARVPLRISIAGGGTDSPAYARESGGFAITAAISQYVYVAINRTFDNGYKLRYSETEHADNIADIKHPIIREALRFYDVPPQVEIVSLADIPSGTGLGSSGAFGVGLCMALGTFVGMRIDQRMAAVHASQIELEILGRPGGRMDHWAVSFGDVRALKFGRTGAVYGTPLDAPIAALDALENSLHLYYTGIRRDAEEVLATQTTEGLDEIKHLGYRAHHKIVAGDIVGIGKMMNDHWILKRKRSDQISNTVIDSAYAVALGHGAIGGKLVGAGGGGFLLMVAPPEATELTPALAFLGMPEIPFTFDHVGATLISTQ